MVCRSRVRWSLLLLGLVVFCRAGAEGDWERLVAETHARSLRLREEALARVAAADSCWPHGVWGDTLWALAALHRNERVEEANARLLAHAQAYLASIPEAGAPGFSPENPHGAPWAYFALGDYVRILCLFHADSPHHPGRLSGETEAAMKEALWRLVKVGSRVANASPDSLLVLLGTENHDLTRRPNEYLVAAILKDDPRFRDRRYDDGHTAEEHFQAYNAFFREWPRRRVASGLWVEIGSDTYQKYSWPALFNLHELSPDPLVRERFGMLLDLAFIEEAQVSVRGRRGGGRSRAGYGANNFEAYQNLLYAVEGIPAAGSHSKILETSRYQLPAAAILLRHMEYSTPFAIANRVLGELDPEPPSGGEGTRYAADSALVNTVWRTPHYLLGSTLQNPGLAMTDAATGAPVLKYAGISRQQRWCGILFDDPASRPPLVGELNRRADDEMCAIYPVVERTRGGRPQHSFWSFQHRQVLVLERIRPQQPEHPMRMGSYSTGRLGIRFHGRNLAKVEEGGWIFATNGRGFAAVRFLDHGYEWDEAREEAWPGDCERMTCTVRILVQAGDRDADGTFEQFRAAVLANPLVVEPDSVAYSFGSGPTRLAVHPYDPDRPDSFRLPRVDGEPVDLRPPWTFRSPYLNARFGEDRAEVTVGPVRQLYDFAVAAVTPLP